MELNDLNVDTSKFGEHGYVILRNLIPGSLLEKFRNDACSVIQAHSRKMALDPESLGEDVLGSGYPEILKRANGSSEVVSSIYDCISGLPSLYAILANEGILRIVREVLGIDIDPFIFMPRCRIDAPSQSRYTYNWHQETFFTIPRSDFVQLWAPVLERSSDSNGTIQLLPRSHRFGVVDQDWQESESRVLQIIPTDSRIDYSTAVSLFLNPGDLILFSGQLIHRSGVNTSQRARYSLICMYHNILKHEFLAPRQVYEYKGRTSKEYYEEEIGKIRAKG